MSNFFLNIERISISDDEFRRSREIVENCMQMIMRLADNLGNQQGFGIFRVRDTLWQLSRHLQKTAWDIDALSRFRRELFDAVSEAERLALRELGDLSSPGGAGTIEVFPIYTIHPVPTPPSFVDFIRLPIIKLPQPLPVRPAPIWSEIFRDIML